MRSIQDKVAELVVIAGKEIMKIYDSNFDVEYKKDNSPVTKADKIAEKIITEGLLEINPDYPVLGEEAVSAGQIPKLENEPYFWVVDAIDGTNSFVAHGEEFTVNIALIENKNPVLGVIYWPLKDELFIGSIYSEPYCIIKGKRQKLAVKDYNIEKLDIITNRTSKVADKIKEYKIGNVFRFNSSIKFCKMAQGLADVYIRDKEINEWDIAAGDAILRSVGGVTCDYENNPVKYGRYPFDFKGISAYTSFDLWQKFHFANIRPYYSAIDDAANLIKKGHLVAFPTETVYGLGANAFDDKAVAKIYEAKNRPTFNPLIVHVADFEMIKELVELNDAAIKIIKEYFPAPLTIVLKKKANSKISELLSCGGDTLAIRMPNNKIALELIKKAGVPIAAPSANKSGSVSPVTAEHVAESLGDKVDLILDGGRCKVGLESTVVDLTGEKPVLLRAGAVQIPNCLILNEEQKIKKAPGMLKSHYAPSIPLRINADKPRAGEAFLGFGKTDFNPTLNLSSKGDLIEAAANLFYMIRQLDNGKYKGIAVAPIPNEGIGGAINDRLKRASI